MARQDHDTLTILFFMFGLGGIVLLIHHRIEYLKHRLQTAGAFLSL
jgi:hypothetical protein